MKKIISLIISFVLIFTVIPLRVFTVSAADDPIFFAAETSGLPGDTVTVDIFVENNPGIVSFQISVGYDATVLEPTSITRGVFSEGTFQKSPLTKNPLKITWNNSIQPNNTSNGVAATVTFKILDTAPIGKSIVSCKLLAALDEELNDVSFNVRDGFVEVLDSPIKTEGLFTYEVVDETVKIISCDTSASGDVVVPNLIQGLPVTTISDSAFNECANITSVLIPDSVTTIGADIFAGCTSLQEILYAGSQGKWNKITADSTNEILNSTSKVCIGDVRFTSAMLTLHDDFAVSYKMNKSVLDNGNFSNVYAVFELDGQTVTVKNYTEQDGKYVFKLKNIPPNKINQNIHSTLYATYKGIEYATSEKDYSVAQYCYNMLEKYSDDANRELRTLLVDLLNYGAKAQIYTDYNTTNLCNANLTDVQKAWATQSEPTVASVKNLEHEVVANPTVDWEGASLKLSDSVIICFAIKAQSTQNLMLTVTDGEKSWKIAADKFIDVGDGIYHIDFDGLDASQMRKSVYATVYYGDTAVSNTVCYSIESYAYEMADSDDANLNNLLIDMIKYGDAAYEYAN